MEWKSMHMISSCIFTHPKSSSEVGIRKTKPGSKKKSYSHMDTKRTLLGIV